MDSLERIGHKALAVNLSDLAAMGARPKAALVTFQLPDCFELQDAQRLFSGIRALANRFDIQIVGGDTNRWKGKLQIGITVIGTPYGSHTWKMSGARDRDVVLVSGTFGGSILGKHLDFEPRLELARHLAENYFPHAVTDASDLLSLDLFSMARASGLGFEIDLGAIPVSKDAIESAQNNDDNLTALDHALYDGEDFELIICASDEQANLMMKDDLMPVALARIGRMTESNEILARHADGSLSPLVVKGYCH
jgi:thiamine-monophosphate kinase